MQISTTLGAGLLTLAASGASLLTAGPSDRTPRTPLVPGAVGPVESTWRLSWDDSLDDLLDASDKHCSVRIEAIDGVVTGRFAGPVLGSTRTATFTGEVAGDGRLLLLQQREPGYVCSYQLTSADGGWRGTWRDTNGAAGTVVLTPPPTTLRADSPSTELPTIDPLLDDVVTQGEAPAASGAARTLDT